MAEPWAELDLSSIAPGASITAANTANFFDMGYAPAGYITAAEVSPGVIGMRPRTTGYANVAKSLAGHEAEGRIGYKVKFLAVVGATTTYAELMGFRNGSTILWDNGLRNASGTREMAARNAFNYGNPPMQALGNPMLANEQWSVEVYWNGTSVTVYVWDSVDTSGTPTYTWGPVTMSALPTNIFMLPDTADSTDMIVYDVWMTDGGRLDAAPIPGTLDFVSNVTVNQTGDELILSGKAIGAAEVQVSFDGDVVPAALDADGYWKASSAIGLGQSVEYQVIVDDTVRRTETTRTLPSGDTLRILLGSCYDVYTSGFFANAVAQDPDLVFGGGDLGYFWTSNTPAGPVAPGVASEIRALKEPMLRSTPVQSLFAKTPSVCIYSDADGAGANSDSTFIGFTSGAVQSAHRQIYAHGELPMADNQGRVIVWKRWRIIITDELTLASAKAAADVPGKTKLGATQLAWFKEQIDIAAAENQAVVWLGDGPFHAASNNTGTGNEWARYNAERQEIVAYLQASGVDQRILRANGDRHAIAVDQGLNNAFGGFPTVNAAPFHTTANPYGLPAEASWPPVKTDSSRQYAVLELVDDGTYLTATAKGYSSTNSAPTEVERFNVTMDFTPDAGHGQEWESVYVGAQEAEAVYLGSELLWSS